MLGMKWGSYCNPAMKCTSSHSLFISPRCKAQVGESSSTDPGTALSVFSCHTVRLRHTTDLRICIPSLSESAEMEVTVSIDVPHLPGIPAGGTSIPFTFDPHLGSRNFSREVLDKDNVDAPVSFMRSTTAPTLTLPPNMTFDEPVGDSPRSSVASCPRGFKTVQPIQGMVDPRWKCPSRPQTPDFDEEHFLLLSPPLRQPMASHSWMKRVSNVKQLAVDFHVNGMITIEMDPVGANAESFEASAYKARIVSMGDEIDAEDTESLQKTTEELVERAPRDLRVGTALGMLVCSKHTQKWKLLKLRIESEIDIWAIDAQEQFANAMRAVVSAGFDRTSGKLCFYPPAVIPPFPVDHTESGEPLYQGLPSLKPTPAGYTAENRPYYNIPSQEEQAVSDAVDASPGIHTFLAGYVSPLRTRPWCSTNFAVCSRAQKAPPSSPHQIRSCLGHQVSPKTESHTIWFHGFTISSKSVRVGSSTIMMHRLKLSLTMTWSDCAEMVTHLPEIMLLHH